MTVSDKPKPPPQQGGPSTAGQGQHPKPPQGQQGSARGPGQQQQGGPSTSGQAQQGSARGPGQQGGPSGQGKQQGKQGSARGPGQQQQPASAWGQGGPPGQGQQRKPPQGQQGQQGQQGSARGPGQQPGSTWGQGSQQQPKPAPGGQQAQQRPPAQQQATPWTRPTQGEPPSTQAGGQRPQQRPAQGPRPAHGKGDQKTKTPKPAIIPYDYKICAYKGVGTRGRKVSIETNYLKLDVSSLVPHAFHYDVTIDFEPAGRSPPGKKFMHPVFAAFVKRNFPKAPLAYDGQKNAYAPKQLDLSREYERVINMTDDETGQTRQFRVEIKEVKGSLIDLSILKK